ncbi:helix-turn-helix domain-containing protein [Nonomuraea sp. NPDC059194]|uniref:helix-turn-helix domain-containing protein n=1 Tax=Nonomuraea sp. NPDC059194 TaxID=3346764 RepID=UPI0036ACF04B
MTRRAFGPELRRWRLLRSLSQLALADEAGTSQRHLSYLERGLARPSRDMVVRLAATLELAPKQRDDLLLAAGLAPEPKPPARSGPLPDPVRETMEAVLRGHLPAPALILGPRGEVVAANAAVALLTEGAAPELSRDPARLCRLMLHPRGMASRVVNLNSWGHHLLEGLRGIARGSGPDPELEEYIAELAGYLPRAAPDPGQLGFAVPLRLRSAGGELRLITTFTSLADPALEGYRLEVFLPADAETAELLRISVT